MPKRNTERRAAMLPWQRRRRRWLLGSLISLILPILVIGGIHWRRERGFEARLAEIRASGMPVTQEDLISLQPPVRPEEDITPLIEKVIEGRSFERYKRNLNRLSYDLRSGASNAELDKPFPEDLHQMLRLYLEQNEEALDKLHQMLSRSALHLSPEAIADPVKMWDLGSRMGEALELLWYESLLSAEENDAERAADAILALLSLSDVFRGVAVYGAQHDRIRFNICGVRASKHALAIAAFSDEQLGQLCEGFSRAEEPDGLYYDLLAERALNLEMYRDCRSVTIPQKYDALGFAVAHGAEILGLIDADRRRYLDFMDEFISAARLPIEERVPVFRDIDRRMDANYKFLPFVEFSITRLNWTSNTNDIFLQSIADLRCASTAFAAERFRLALGELPESLSELTGSFLTEIPLDPFDGQPLRYQRTGAGYAVYSVGRNLMDDGGTSTDDLIFHVPR